MPPRPTLTSFFSVADASNETVCPLLSGDGGPCRKRCIGEKRFRSMQEHIRRAHPYHYISKLPATEESFILMINTPPSERPVQGNAAMGPSTTGYEPNTFLSHNKSSTSSTQTTVQCRPSMLPAATALAQLHDSRMEPKWTSEQATYAGLENESYLQNYYVATGDQGTFNDIAISNSDPPLHAGVAPDFLNRTLSGRATSLQPFPRAIKGVRVRKTSVTERARKPKHQKQRSRDLKRFSLGNDREATSVTPSSVGGGSKWEDLLDAAASATEEDSHDLTPIPQSPRSPLHSPLPLFSHQSQFQSYATSPLQKSILPHSPIHDPDPAFTVPNLEPFPSVETSHYSPQGAHEHLTHNGGNSNQPYQPHPLYYHHNQASASNESAASDGFSLRHTNHHPHNSSDSSFNLPPSTLSSSSPILPSNNDMNEHTAYQPDLYSPHEYQQQPQPQYHPPIQHQSPLLQRHNSHHTPHSPLLHRHNSYQSYQSPVNTSHHSSVHISHQSSIHSPHHLQNQLPPSLSPPQIQHYCAACHRVAPLTSSYACTECICGICKDCVDVLQGMGPERGARCPRCKTIMGRWKPFMLDLR